MVIFNLKLRLSGILILALAFIPSGSVRANDLEKFFNALRGGNRGHSNPVVHSIGHRHGAGQVAGHQGHTPTMAGLQSHNQRFARDLTSRDVYKLQQNADRGRRGSDHHHFAHSEHDFHSVHNQTLNRYSNAGTRSGIRLSFSIGAGRSQPYHSVAVQPAPLYLSGPGYPGTACVTAGIPEIPLAPLQFEPPHPNLLAMPHQIGEIVDCQVPLVAGVRIEDPENIAPGAVPVVVAVRDPCLPPWVEGCTDSVVYVEVCVPQCPLQKLTISPCRTRIKLDFGRYAVDVKSRDGRIVVDYDD